jgi:hypothetical protein
MISSGRSISSPSPTSRGGGGGSNSSVMRRMSSTRHARSSSSNYSIDRASALAARRDRLGHPSESEQSASSSSSDDEESTTVVVESVAVAVALAGSSSRPRGNKGRASGCQTPKDKDSKVKTVKKPKKKVVPGELEHTDHGICSYADDGIRTLAEKEIAIHARPIATWTLQVLYLSILCFRPQKSHLYLSTLCCCLGIAIGAFSIQPKEAWTSLISHSTSYIIVCC